MNAYNAYVDIVPCATDDMAQLDWEIDTKFLEKVRDLAVSKYDCGRVSLEEVEAVILTLIQLGYMRSIK